jgi:FtsH-binding integral membrane protein
MLVMLLLAAADAEPKAFDFTETLASWAMALALTGAMFTLLSLTSLWFHEPQRRDAYGLAMLGILLSGLLVCWWLLVQRQLSQVANPPSQWVFWLGLGMLFVSCVEMIFLQRAQQKSGS